MLSPVAYPFVTFKVQFDKVNRFSDAKKKGGLQTQTVGTKLFTAAMGDWNAVSVTKHLLLKDPQLCDITALQAETEDNSRLNCFILLIYSFIHHNSCLKAI